MCLCMSLCLKILKHVYRQKTANLLTELFNEKNDIFIEI